MSFIAKYPGRCGAGCDGIDTGDEVEYVDDVLSHIDCEGSEGLYEERPWNKKTETCTKCWLIKPCECDDS